jgi:5'-deoxynucleotidase
MAELSLEERLRTAHVHRWQIVRVAREQTLAEHLYLVRVISLAFAEAAGFSVAETCVAEQWALEHDVPEVRTGDLATPIKAAMREAIPHDDPVRRIELSISQKYCDLYTEVKTKYPQVQLLVKLADLTEAVNFLNVEGMGTHADTVKRRLWKAFFDLISTAPKRFPDYTWAKVYDVAKRQTGA